VGPGVGWVVGVWAAQAGSGEVGVVGAAGLAVLYKQLSYNMIVDALGSTIKLTAMLIIILACSKVLGQLLAFTGSTQAMILAIGDWNLPALALLILLLFIPFVLCMFLDQIALMLILIPVYAPLANSVGYDPIWFWTLFLIVLTVGSITPPFGYTLFALRAADPTLSISDIYKASIPFVGIFLLSICIFVVFPGIVTALPSAG